MHMEMPKMVVQTGEQEGFGEELGRAISQGNERIRTRRVIMEEVERTSGDQPLPPANYPTDFEPDTARVPQDIAHDLEGVEGIHAEGDTEYNPDEEA
jgi:hypothetical protein